VSRGWTRSLYCAADTPNFALALVGKDAGRWIVQCVDFAGRDEALAHAGIRPQSFADLLVNHAPPAVAARFRSWGVADTAAFYRGHRDQCLVSQPAGFRRDFD
jgi:hypothetical protein